MIKNNNLNRISTISPLLVAGVGAGISALGSFFGSKSAKREAKRQQELLDQEKRENENRWLRDINEDALQSATAQRALTKAREMYDENIERAQGQQAVMGGTDASVAQAKEVASKGIADASSNIVTMADAKQDKADALYQDTKNRLNAEQNALYQQRAMQSAQAGQNLINAGMGLASAGVQAYLNNYKDLFNTKK